MAILTISREFGSGGKEIGRAVADSLGFEYVDKEKVLIEVRKAGSKWESWGKELDEHSPSVWEKYDWSFRGFGALIQSYILSRAVKDRVVIMGRGANFLLKGIPFALSVRIVAPMEARIARIVARESIDQEKARWLAEKMDRERSGFLYSLYGKHWDDPSEYDFVLNTGSKPVNEIVDLIKGLLADRDRLSTEESRKVLEMRALAARIKAGLFTNPSLFIPTLDLGYDGKTLVLRGIIHNPKEHERLEKAARDLAEGVPLRCELHYRR